MEPDITVDNKVKELVSQNKVPEAVKPVMDHYKCGLEQAKDYTDKLTGRIKNWTNTTKKKFYLSFIVMNRVAPEVEAAVVKMATDNPAFGQVRVANELRKQAIMFVILLAVADENVVIISFNDAGHLRIISLCKLNLV